MVVVALGATVVVDAPGLSVTGGMLGTRVNTGRLTVVDVWLQSSNVTSIEADPSAPALSIASAIRVKVPGVSEVARPDHVVELDVVRLKY